MPKTTTVSLVVVAAVSEELARVLSDARCSFCDRSGRFHLVDGLEVTDGESDAFARVATAALDANSPTAAVIDLASGREGKHPGALGNPIELLHWLVTQPAGLGFHPTVNSYIASSDPDEILPFLPFHPGNKRGGTGTSPVVVVRVALERDAAGEITEVAIAS